jgi:hypothetical protein
MQHDINIEDKLREMEAIEQPDLSQVDVHWQQMQAMLQPGSIPVKKGWPKWMLNMLFVSAAAILIGIAIWYITSKKNSWDADNVAHSGQKEETPSINAMKPVSAILKTDSAAVTTESSVLHQPKAATSLIHDTGVLGNDTGWLSQDSILGTMKIKFTDCDNCPLKNNAEAIAISDAQRRQLQLQYLFKQLEKGEQHFIIDNSRDTLLQFEEGTVLLLPANSLGGMKGIEITAKEFYKTADIILNQLNTMSNKDQLETGGMIYLKASYKGNEVNVSKQNPLVLVLPDTTENIAGMRLFTGDTTSDAMQLNWKPQSQFFSKTRLVTEARVVNLVNEPYKIKNTTKGDIAYFILGDDETIDKEKIRQQLKEKYTYYKVRLRPNFYKAFHSTYYNEYSGYSRYIGDSVWMDIGRANKYHLDIISTRQYYVNENGSSSYYNLSENSKNLFKQVLNKYSVSLSGTGWINCDRFYNYPGKRIDFAVDLGDSAYNYYCVLLFDNIRSLMNGYLSGNHMIFPNIPGNLPATIIVIGINKKGETVYSVTHTTTSEQELRGLQFQATSVPDLRAALSKYDK